MQPSPPPVAPRSAARLTVVARNAGKIFPKRFAASAPRGNEGMPHSDEKYCGVDEDDERFCGEDDGAIAIVISFVCGRPRF